MIDYEVQEVEYKRIWKKEVLEEICGAANSKGCRFFIGKDDNGNTVGLEKKEVIKLLTDIPSQIVHTMHYYDVSVDANEDDKGTFIVIDVQKSSQPVFYQGKMYKRIGISNFLVEGKEQQNAFIDLRNKTWDSTVIEGVSIDDLDEDSFQIFREEAVKSGKLSGSSLKSNESILEELELMKDGKLTTAAVLLFHKQPHKIIPGAYVQIGKMRSDADLVTHDEIKGSIMSLTRSVLDIMQVKYLSALVSYDDAIRIETYPYPYNALREAIFNSLMHNDWSAGQPILIKVYNYSLSIMNRSILDEGWTVSKHKSRHINPLISNTFNKAGLVEKFGTGILKIFDSCKQERNPEPIFETANDGLDFTVTFQASDLYLALESFRKDHTNENSLVEYRKVVGMMDKIDRSKFIDRRLDTIFTHNGSEKLEVDGENRNIHSHSDGENQNIHSHGDGENNLAPAIKTPSSNSNNKTTLDGYKMVLMDNRPLFNLIKENPVISYEEMAKELNISESTVTRRVRQLRDEGYIAWDGSQKNGHWVVLKEIDSNI